MVRPLDQPMDSRLRDFVQEALKEIQGQAYEFHYRQIAKRLGVLLSIHGLGQTLSYLRLRGGGRPNSPFTVLEQHLSRWLQTMLGLSSEDVLDELTRRDSSFYLQASDAAWEFALALKRALEEVKG